ncbi:MAG TPA: gliding motility lipoprotein GldH [Bacteroidales bacterium]|nr:gliding motility lipoprotein GldH [Bacteroidales bacterium]MBP7874747.1 gliding motility lipoprotein GldH [Bacteroidales bacterium]MCZ2283096.1 gliding motility lipoprotein GldH [Bacteroidales bacterium]HPX34797.1 gliding motility lipoprotein GldH [Bacteroidales bacterium]HQB48065.1 gliding motility lipoprotein GldH [Bacteroidales bacterium]
MNRSFLKNNLTNPIILLFIYASICLVTSCDQNRFFDQSVKIPETGWHLDSVAMFELEVMDTLGFYSFYINLRNTTNYTYSNFYLFLNTTLPDGEHARDTIELILADKKGKWIGKGSGRLRDNQILIRPNLHFPLKGKYVFGIQHAMRDTILTDIKNIGIRIEKW